MRLGAVILAAGDSTRMGAPKALLARDGESVAARCVRLARAAGCGPVAVVLGRQAWWVGGVLERALPPDVVWVQNPMPERGRSGSLKRGLAALGPVDGALVWPVDRPLAAEATLRSLAHAAVAGAQITLPVVRGHRGHPVLLAGEALAEAAALHDDEPLRDIIHRVPGRIVEIRGDEGCLANLDTPQAAASANLLRPLDNDARDNTCLVCGPRNPVGLRLQFYRGGDRVVAWWQPSDAYSGWPGYVIDGIRLAVLTDALVWGAFGLTGTLPEWDAQPVHELHSLRTTAPVKIEAWLAPSPGAPLRVEATLLQDGEIRGRAAIAGHLPDAAELRAALQDPARPASVKATLEERLQALDAKEP